MNLIRKIILSCLLILVLFPKQYNSQELLLSENNFGFNIGANLAFGSHVRRLGLNFTFFYFNTRVQTNSEVRAYFNFKNLGPSGVHPELVLTQGIVYAYGKEANYFNPFITSVSNQTGFLSSFAYSYNAFFNTKHTRQQTGIFSIEVNRISLITENDILARGYYDRFRTAAFLIQYQFEDKWQAAINCSMWTGQYRKKSQNANPAFYNGCYMDTVNGIYTNQSHGLLSAQFKYNTVYSQNVQANLGIDAEQVRNVMQNKFIHDMRFIPKKWNKAKNCHIPMLDENQNQYLFKEGQKIRQPKLYWNLFTNANVFY